MSAEPDPFRDEPTLPQLPALPRDTSEGPSRKRAFPFRAPSTDGFLSSDIGVFSSDDDPGLDNYIQARRKRHHRGTWYDHNHATPDPGREQDEDESEEDVVPETPKAKVLPVRGNETVKKSAARLVAAGSGQPPPTPPSSGPLASYSAVALPSYAFAPLPGHPSSQAFSSSQTFSPGRVPASSQVLPSSQGHMSPATRKQLTLGQTVMQKIESCIDKGQSVIDLTEMGLEDESLSADTFRPLVDLKLVPCVEAQEHVGPSHDPLTTSKDGYLHRESRIVLIMANNRLSRLPGTIFDIENLVELSLRRNRLLELPTAIAKCKGLRSLNLSYNKLRWLPFELIERLPQLDQLNLVGNSFYEPDYFVTDQWEWDSSYIDVADLPPYLQDQHKTTMVRHRNNNVIVYPRPSAWYLGRSPVQFTDTSGRFYSSFRLPPAGGKKHRIRMVEPGERTAPLPRHQGESQSRSGQNQESSYTRVPSLVEVCARSLAKSARPEDLADISPSDPDIVANVMSAASETQAARGGGGTDDRRCAVCGKAFVIPRAQWVEFYWKGEGWFASSWAVNPKPGRERITNGEGWPPRTEVGRNVVPCLRRGCSWNCVPYGGGREQRPGQRVVPKWPGTPAGWFWYKDRDGTKVVDVTCVLPEPL